MKYKYRWLYAIPASAAMMIGGIYYDIQPGLAQLANLHEIEMGTTKELSRFKQFAVQKAAASAGTEAKSFKRYGSQADSLSDLLSLAHLQGLTIQSVNFAPSRQFNIINTGVNTEAIHLVTQGDFSQIYSFIFMISRQPHPILITDFLYKSTEQNKFLFAMNVVSFKSNTQHFQTNKSHEDLSQMQNPFCPAANLVEMSNKNDLAKLKSISMDQLKMVGYFQQGIRSQALVMAPTGIVSEVGIGSVLGKEGGMVTEIKRDCVVVVLRDKKRWVMKI